MDTRWHPNVSKTHQASNATMLFTSSLAIDQTCLKKWTCTDACPCTLRLARAVWLQHRLMIVRSHFLQRSLLTIFWLPTWLLFFNGIIFAHLLDAKKKKKGEDGSSTTSSHCFSVGATSTSSEENRGFGIFSFQIDPYFFNAKWLDDYCFVEMVFSICACLWNV